MARYLEYADRLLAACGARRSEMVKEPPDQGTVHTVSTKTAFTDLTDNTSSTFVSGDTIKITDGTYNNWGAVAVRGRDAPNALIKPQTHLGVTFSGDTTFFCSSPDTVWWGFNVDKDGGTLQDWMRFGGDGITRGHRCELYGFEATGGGITSNDIFVDIEGQTTEGTDDIILHDNILSNHNMRLCNITATNQPWVPGKRAHIHHNSVVQPSAQHDIIGMGYGFYVNQVDPYSGYYTHALVEFNYFELGDYDSAEFWEVKSNDNTFRYNYILSNLDAVRFIARGGDRNVFYGNFLGLDARYAFSVNADDNSFRHNMIVSEVSSTGVLLLCDSGTEPTRDTGCNRAIIRDNILIGQFQSYSPVQNNSPLNTRPQDCVIDDNTWVHTANPVYSDAGTGITEAQMETDNTGINTSITKTDPSAFVFPKEVGRGRVLRNPANANCPPFWWGGGKSRRMR